MSLLGVDISKWQEDVNFSSLAKNQDFIILRSSYGTGYTDEKFARNRDGCRKEGIPHGFYHYSYPNHNTPEQEADWFLSVVAPLESGELLCLDFEESYPDPVDWSKRFLDRVSEQLDGYKPLLYINKYLTKTYDWTPVASKGYGLWLAYWDYNPEGAFEVPYWETVAMRQYSNNLTVNGIDGRVDGNVFYGDKDQFLAYGVTTGEIPCKKVILENEQLKSDLTAITKQRDGLLKPLNDLNTLYKKLLEEDKIEDAVTVKLIKDFDTLTKAFKVETDKVFKKDKEILVLKGLNKKLLEDNERLKLQKFTFKESLVFLFRSLKEGDTA